MTTRDEIPNLPNAACTTTDPETFFPRIGGNNIHDTLDAIAVCLRCPVRTECLEWALTHDQRFGIWGGMTEKQRRELARTRKAKAARYDPRTATSRSVS